MKQISVIIPTYHFADVAKLVIENTINQTLPPSEIIVIDSSEDYLIKDSIESLRSEIPIIYHRVTKLFPGEARNKGFELAKYDWLAFLDSKTIPVSNWLKTSIDFLEKNNFDVVFGSTQYLATSSFQMELRACSFGKQRIETSPGSVISRENFIKSGGFQENVRTGDDLAWRNTMKSLGFSGSQPNEVTLTYNELPTKLFETIKRFFVYQLHGSKVHIQNTNKNIILSFVLIFLTILIPKWNALVGWEDSILYIPNITKIYVLFLIFSSFIILLFKRKLVKEYSGSLLGFTFFIIIFMSLFFCAFYWNDSIAGWVEDSVWYFPHITKIYIGFILFCSLFYRGVYFPLRHGYRTHELLPFWWIKVGFLGLLLDFAKAPGYLLGALIQLLSNKK
jgi:glycosyltransferase involved in cell wall biosynthesis